MNLRHIVISAMVPLLGSLGCAAAPHDGVRGCAAASLAACYANDFLLSLDAAHRGSMVAASDTAGAGGDPNSQGRAIMYIAKRQQSAIESAVATLDEYRLVADSAVREVAAATTASYRLLASAREGTVEEIRTLLDGTGGGGAGSFAERAADLQLMRKQGAEGLIVAAAALAGALLDTETSTLRMTASERYDLLLLIDNTFGSDLEPVDGQYASDFVPPVVALRQFLMDGWRVQDARR